MTAVLFDLDGTLADTAPDLAHTLNQILIREGRDPLPYETIRPHVSHGAAALIRRGFGIGPGEPGFAGLRAYFLAHYRDNLCRETRLFAGMDEVLSTLERSGIPWGVVTNKPACLTEPLMAALGLDTRAGCIVSGDTLPQSKPHPAPILHACERIAADPGRTIFVGDAERDIQAGRAAGTRTLVALFGYLDEQDAPADWGADGLVDNPIDILKWLVAVRPLPRVSNA
ncbi:MAG: phosphoglycolate phosphatase [Gammaproteobacteria bacterium RIFOXYA12_FULL_61_12]|nr:MAG: phosphoglycolate phosphatase [Gammaproteobacteria bacterium RIFOXYD12_FULL_61_37]OGT94610.1 MAG: phosphoglycolate phosphatase [Gammaproteobacteria bacterium RIFOXYA12_FULL_61_12]